MTYTVYIYDFDSFAESNEFDTSEQVREFLTSVEIASKIEVEIDGVEVNNVDWMDYSQVEEWSKNEPVSPLNQVMTLKEASAEFNLADSTLRRAILEGRLKGRKSGGTWLVLRSDVQEQYGNTKIEIEFPMDLLWQEADPDDYDADSTESQYLEAIENALYKAGYSADASFSSVASTEIRDNDGNTINDEHYHIIKGVIDSVNPDYIEFNEDE